MSLEKATERWWGQAFKSEPAIDLGAIDKSRPMEDLDQEALMTVQKLVWEQERKLNERRRSDSEC